MSLDFTFVESSQLNGVLHWRCEFNQDSTAMWIPVPYDDLILESSTLKHSASFRRPSSKFMKMNYIQGSVLHGTRVRLNTFTGLHESTQDKLDQYKEANSGVNSLSTYAQNTDNFLQTMHRSISITARLPDRTLRRRISSASGLNKTQLQTLFALHDFLSTDCGYGEKNVTLTNSISQIDFYDQPHFTKKFLNVFGCSPTRFFKEFDGLPEQLLTISYKYLPDFHDILSKLQDKET